MLKTETILFDLSDEVTDYFQILSAQRFLNNLRNSGSIPDVIMTLQHRNVYTTGIHDNPSEYTGLSGLPVKVERGGSITYHGPGQLVVYFIISLKDRGINILDLIRAVQDSVVAYLAIFGVAAEGRLGKETGIWIQSRKICSIGFAVREFATLHGIALNISTDLRAFEVIKPCGFPSAVMTSLLSETGKNVDVKDAARGLYDELVCRLPIKTAEIHRGIESLERYVSEQLSETAHAKIGADSSMTRSPFR
ncbi:MAG TPA: lipoyl(octanoyl) transferase LipB [Thermoplasmataceae archaeon]|nr:lipoyl(octanoyl) transferase LipB [Thermoplasmatales archaeon AK]HLH85369.1 lipoyl(octanoyl) transferase LipB [Thermoplasmataceae archaeon]